MVSTYTAFRTDGSGEKRTGRSSRLRLESLAGLSKPGLAKGVAPRPAFAGLTPHNISPRTVLVSEESEKMLNPAGMPFVLP
jgi:hypothetical protein